MTSLAAIDPFTIVTTCIWIGVALMGLMLYHIANKPPARKETERREDEAYRLGFARGYRKGLESEPQSIRKNDQ